MTNLKILSASDANGWYRVRGTRDSNEIEKLAVWSAICKRRKGKKNNKYLVVGMIPADIGRNGYDHRYFVDDVAGYVHETELENGFVNAEAFKRLKWPSKTASEAARKKKKLSRKSKKAKAKKALLKKYKSKDNSKDKAKGASKDKKTSSKSDKK